MSVSFSAALDGAWRRMVALLFAPFDLARWFVVGFAAWLAGLQTAGSGDAGLKYVFDADENWEVGTWPEHASATWREILADVWIASLVVGLVLVGIVIAVVLLWVGSRGQFVFLDNVVHRRAAIVQPWRDHARLGDSLFLWRLLYGLVVAGVVTALVVAGVVAAGGVMALDEAALTLPFFLAAGVVVFVLAVVLGFVDFFLLHAVVPVMYRHGCGVLEGWRRFGTVFRRAPGTLVVFGLLQLAVALATTAVLVAAGMVTCCAGFLVMAVPYVGTVVTLPVPVFRRYLDLEVLGRLERDWDLRTDASAEVQLEGDGTVIGPEDVGPDAGGDEPRDEDA